MGNNPGKDSPDCDEKAVLATVPLTLFVVGFLLAILVLVYTPSLYRRLRYGKKHMCKLCCYFTNCPRRKEPSFAPRTRPVHGNARYYTEIDEESIPRNLQPRNLLGAQYEEMVVDNNTHRYSVVEGYGGRYEDVPKPSQLTETDESARQPIYHILEPNTYKRLPVRLFTQLVEQKESNVYFVLEPNTNNVKPTFEKPSASSDHTYFVLEPERMPQEMFDVEAYAVSDLEDSHAYFILEKS